MKVPYKAPTHAVQPNLRYSPQSDDIESTSTNVSLTNLSLRKVLASSRPVLESSRLNSKGEPKKGIYFVHKQGEHQKSNKYSMDKWRKSVEKM